MSDRAARTVTLLLKRCHPGEEGALAAVVPLVYDELLRLARRHMRGERRGHTLQPTALVHEAYARLVKADVPLESRVQFFAIASTAMRRILVDHARARASLKRGGGAAAVTLDEALAGPERDADVVEVDAALERLAEVDPRKARIVELHYFGGLTHAEIATAMGVSAATVDRDLRFARAWLKGRIEGGSESPGRAARGG
jgi:RNA polymerase sigma factor (TIGR02999 family)